MCVLSTLPEQIGGPGEIVEIDESMLVSRKNNVGRMLGSGWVFGGIQRGDPSKMFIVLVPDRTAETLLTIIRNKIRPGTTIATDGWASYSSIESMGLEYRHLTVNHSENFVNPENNLAHTQNVESMWRWLKRKFKTTTKDSNKRIARLGEFCYRRVHKDRVFEAILNDIKLTLWA